MLWDHPSWRGEKGERLQETIYWVQRVRGELLAEKKREEKGMKRDGREQGKSWATSKGSTGPWGLV